MSLTLEIKQALMEMGGASIRQIAARLDIPGADYAGRRKVRDALRNLVEFGLVKRAERPGENEALYYLTGKAGMRGETQEKVWRAILVKRLGFTGKDLAILSGASRDYIRRYLRYLKTQGFIQETGRQKLSRFGVGLRYRLAPGKEKEAAPKFKWREEARRARERLVQAKEGAGRARDKEEMDRLMKVVRDEVSLAITYATSANVHLAYLERELEKL
jgi:predicted transcriptional regulator